MTYVSFGKTIEIELDDSTQYATVRTHGVVKGLPDGYPLATLERRRVLDKKGPVWKLYDNRGELIHFWMYSPDYQSLTDDVARALANSETILRVANERKNND